MSARIYNIIFVPSDGLRRHWLGWGCLEHMFSMHMHIFMHQGRLCLASKTIVQGTPNPAIYDGLHRNV